VFAELVHAAMPACLLQRLSCRAASCDFSDKACAQAVRRVGGAKMSLHDQANALRCETRANYTSLGDRPKRRATRYATCRQPSLQRCYRTQSVPPSWDPYLLPRAELVSLGAHEAHDQTFA